MRGWIILCTLCLLALFYPCDELHCWDNAGNRIGSWSETSCNGYIRTGTWTGYVTNDCRFVGTGEWESVTGTINPSTKAFNATGKIRENCGSITLTGAFTSNLIDVSGNYHYSKGGYGSFIGRIQP